MAKLIYYTLRRTMQARQGSSTRLSTRWPLGSFESSDRIAWQVVLSHPTCDIRLSNGSHWAPPDGHSMLVRLIFYVSQFSPAGGGKNEKSPTLALLAFTSDF